MLYNYDMDNLDIGDSTIESKGFSKTTRINLIAFCIYFLTGIICILSGDKLAAIFSFVCLPFFYITQAIVLIVISFKNVVKTKKDGNYFAFAMLLLVVGLVMSILSYGQMAKGIRL